MKVAAWIYWVAPETDHDFHVILGSTATLTSTTIFMNSEVSGLPSANPTKSPFPQRRATIRAILANHQNANGLFVTPVPVTSPRPGASTQFPNEQRATLRGAFAGKTKVQ